MPEQQRTTRGGGLSNGRWSKWREGAETMTCCAAGPCDNPDCQVCAAGRLPQPETALQRMADAEEAARKKLLGIKSR